MGVKTTLICDTCQAEKSFAAPYNIIKIAMKEAGWHNVNVGTQERPEWKIRCPGCAGK